MPHARAWMAGQQALLAALAGGLCAVAAIRLPLFRMWMQEDAWAEWATFLAFAIAAGLAIDGARRRGGARLERLALAGLAAFCLFVAGEEISWGQRLLAFRPPEVFLRDNYQQEAELHNLLRGTFDTRDQVMLVAGLYAAAGVAARLSRRVPAALGAHPAMVPWLALVALLEWRYPWDLTGELAELLLGLAMLGDVAIRRGGAAGFRAGALAQAAAVAASLAVPPALDRTLYGPAPVAAENARAELEALARDIARPGVVRPKVFGKSRVHKRAHTAVVQGYLRFGRDSRFLEGRPAAGEDAPGARRDRRGWFLDPWNQPLWVVLAPERDGGVHGLVYSFGANRRRDTNVRRVPDQMAGDDVGAMFRLP